MVEEYRADGEKQETEKGGGGKQMSHCEGFVCRLCQNPRTNSEGPEEP